MFGFALHLAIGCRLLLGSCAAADELTVRAPQNTAAAVQFTRDVLPVLTKAGCNGGACHGSFQGRGGLPLSLWGFDPIADYQALTKDARGRRVFPAAPDHSLMLRKATLAVPHGGGKRFDADTESYQILSAWIAQGLAPPSPHDARITRLVVEPDTVEIASEGEIPLRVFATWSDGEVKDVTRWCRYQTSSEQTASVSGDGYIKAAQPGRTNVTVLLGGATACVVVTVPYGERRDFEFASTHWIDDHLSAEWRALGLTPSRRATDEEFIRRVYLDVIGTLPTPDEVRTFLASRDPVKRRQLVDALLEHPAYEDYWALRWSDRLKIHRRTLGEKGLASFSNWLRQALRENQPWNEVVRELLTAEGNLYSTGPVAFFFVDQTPQDLAETTAQVFLGVRLQCARCHHHPLEMWSQDDYYGLAAFFTDISRKDTKEAGRFGGAQAVTLSRGQSLPHPVSGMPVTARLLGGPVFTRDVADKRIELAQWITDPSNPYFAKNIVNRYWADLMGRGLVDPPDDFRATNPPSNPELLEALAEDFVAHGYDIRHLIRSICTSEAYQRATVLAPERDREGVFYSHFAPRRLSAEVLLDAINQVCGATEPFDGFPSGTRAISLSDPAVPSYFLDVFGRPVRISNCECQRGERSDLRQVLSLANSVRMQDKIASRTGRLAALLESGRSDREILDELYLAALARLPTKQEFETAERYLAAAPSRQEGFEDVLWALLNLPEFLFNH